MKVRVTVENEQYEIEIADLSARPIVAEVNGRRYEVWLDETPLVRPAASAPAGPVGAPVSAAPPKPVPAAAAARPAVRSADGSARSILAPIPGVIVEVTVRPGDAVAPGQQVCVLEAMKMKNMIRAPRAGTIGAVRVSTGQHVKHHDVLIDYAD